MKLLLRIFFLFFLIFFTLSSFNCALFQKKNLRLTTAVEENLVPEESPGNILAAPLYLPIGVLAGILDVFVVHPIAVIPDASKDTISALWTSRNVGYYTKMGAIPFSILATPPLFLISWSYHWFFNKGDYYLEKNNTQPVPKKEISYEDWKKEMEIVIRDKNLSKLHLFYKDHVRYRENPETVHLLIEARKVNMERIKKSKERDLLKEILSYPSTNDEVRSYILHDYINNNEIYQYEDFLKKCKYSECRIAVLKKIQTLGNEPHLMAETIKLYFHMASPAEKEKFMKQLNAIE